MAALMGTDKLHVEESEAYFRNLLESAPDAMIIVDEKGEIVIVNAQAETMFGFSREEMIGQPVGPARAPVGPMSDEARAQLRQILGEAGVL